MIDDIDDDTKLSVVFTIVDKSYPPDLYISLKRLFVVGGNPNYESKIGKM